MLLEIWEIYHVLRAKHKYLLSACANTKTVDVPAHLSFKEFIHKDGTSSQRKKKWKQTHLHYYTYCSADRALRLCFLLCEGGRYVGHEKLTKHGGGIQSTFPLHHIKNWHGNLGPARIL